MKTILLGALLILILPITAYAQTPNQTIQQINNDFPISIIVTDSGGDSARMLLEAIVDPGFDPARIIWGNTGMSVGVLDHKVDSDPTQTVSVDTKQHLYPMTARVRNLQDDVRLDTVFFERGRGEFSLEDTTKGIYVLDIIVKSDQTGNVGIYESILYVDDPERDDYKITQLTAGPTERELLRFAQINVTRVLQ
jgi:hypothetical protein